MSQIEELIPSSIQKILNIFVFFLAFPSVNILGNSITFYIFFLLILKFGPYWKKNYKGKLLFVLLFVLILISSAFAPYDKLLNHPGIQSTIQLTVQYTYWLLAAIFFINYRDKINLIELSKWFFYGTVCLIIGYYFLPFKFGSDFLGISFSQTRNSFVFNLFCSIPLSFLYIANNYSKRTQILLIFLFLFALLMSNGRSGAIIGLIEIMLILMMLFPIWSKTLRFFLIPFLFVFILLQTKSTQVYLDILAEQIETINPRFATLLRGEGEGDLTMDKSWLIRKLMIDKGFEIFEEHPFFGIGPNNFKYYNSKLSTLKFYERLGNHSVQFYNTRSAHNSYLQFLADFGILGLIIFIFILVIPILFFIRLLVLERFTMYHIPLVSLIGISIHFYAVSSVTGAIPWIVIGLAWASLKDFKQSYQ